MGDPSNAHDLPKIAEAARFSGASEFISTLPEGMDTILDPSIRLHTEGHQDQVQALVRRIEHPRKELNTMDLNRTLSGGQLQKLALARMFMRPIEDVRLCLYDEPSAALDPDAEYELFERLRLHRGQKTMIYSSHRFGHLTKHADLILCMKGGTAVEAGTHNELLALNGDYARLYNVQAQAFRE